VEIYVQTYTHVVFYILCFNLLCKRCDDVLVELGEGPLELEGAVILAARRVSSDEPAGVHHLDQKIGPKGPRDRKIRCITETTQPEQKTNS